MPLQFRFALLLFASWVSRHRQDVIEYLKTENRVLREQLGDRRLRLTDAQRCQLAVAGKRLGCKLLGQVATLGPELERTEGRIVCRSRLGGLLRYYYRRAA